MEQSQNIPIGDVDWDLVATRIVDLLPTIDKAKTREEKEEIIRNELRSFPLLPKSS